MGEGKDGESEGGGRGLCPFYFVLAATILA